MFVNAIYLVQVFLCRKVGYFRAVTELKDQALLGVFAGIVKMVVVKAGQTHAEWQDEWGGHDVMITDWPHEIFPSYVSVRWSKTKDIV